MTDCSTLSERTGHCIMFVGNEAEHWGIADLINAASHAKSLGCDAVCVKRADGTLKWYGTPAHLKAEYDAIEALGMHYLPMSYSYRVVSGAVQVQPECDVALEMQGVCGGIVVVNMEREWNGQKDAALAFAQRMHAHKAANSLLIISTWADPQEQDWVEVTKALLPCVDIWWPEQYTNWLAGQEKQLTDLGEMCIQPTIDLSYPATIDDYAALARLAKSRGHTTMSIWEYGDIADKEASIMGIAALMHAQTIAAPTVNVGPIQAKGEPMTIPLNHAGEVIDAANANQFEPNGESAYECVAFSVAICHYGGKPGQGPTGSPEDIDRLADSWYTRFTGSLTNSNGLSVNQETQMIVGTGNHYLILPVEAATQHDSDIANVKGALMRGYPVIICGAETGMYDMRLGDRVPYGWPPSGNHAIVATGIAKDGNLLVRDPANVDGNGVRPGPRTYDIGKLDLISAVVFVPSWMSRPDDKTDWTAPLATAASITVAGVPHGWIDDSHTLYGPAPALLPITGALRQHILSSSWHPDNYPLGPAQHMKPVEGSNPALGAGLQQVFRYSLLCVLDGQSGVIEESVGSELAWSRSEFAKAAKKLDNARAYIEELRKYIDQLVAATSAV